MIRLTSTYSLALAFWLVSFAAPHAAAQSLVISDFECGAVGTQIPLDPATDCDGNHATTYGHRGNYIDAPSILCTSGGMPTTGQGMVELLAYLGIGFPYVMGSQIPVWPPPLSGIGGLDSGSVLENEFIATSDRIAVDWMYLGRTGDTAVLQILLVDPVTDAILSTFAVEDSTTVTFTPSTCYYSYQVPIPPTIFLVPLETTGVQTSMVTVPASHIGQPVKFVAMITDTPTTLTLAPIPIPGRGGLYLDNLRFLPSSDIAEVELETITPFLLDSVSGTYSLQSTVNSVTLTSGAVIDDASVDPVIGATVSMSGQFTGNPADLSTVTLGAAPLNITAAPGSDALSLFAIYNHQAPDVSDLGGPFGCTPFLRRALSSTTAPVPIRTGSGSLILDSMAAQAPAASLSLVVRDSLAGGFDFVESLSFDYVAATQEKHVNMNTDGNGSLVLGFVGGAATEELYNVMVFNPMVPVGTGPFFGVELAPSVIDILSFPLGVHPFHVAPDANGHYFFGIPTGSIPAGFTMDLVSGTRLPAAGTPNWVSPVMRVTF